MYNHDDFLKVIKTAAKSTLDANKPTSLCIGEVLGKNPLRVKIDQKLILDEDNLILTKGVKDYEQEIFIKGEKIKIEIYNRPQKGDLVIMIKLHGGQDFLVIDKMENKNDT